jgi:hypothetical protein
MPVDQDTGAVDQVTVLEVLKCHHVSIGTDQDCPGQTILTRGDKIDARAFTEWVERDALQFFQRTFGVPIAHFYHPEWAREMATKAKVPSK